MEDNIILHGMVFYGFHGVKAAEKELGQRFIVDMEMFLPLEEAGCSDDLDKTVHYGHVYKLVKEIVTGESKDLIEAVAEEIARQVLAKFHRVQSIRVRIRKPEAPIEGCLDYAGVEIVRGRSNG